MAVLPIQENVDEPLKDQDITVITQRGHGPGGQHQNKTDSAVRMKHIPSGITVFINGRDQHSNKKEARKILTARVNDLRRSQSDVAYANFRKEQLGNGSRGNKVRTYNFIDSRVADHRFGIKTRKITAVMTGNISLLFPTK